MSRKGLYLLLLSLGSLIGSAQDSLQETSKNPILYADMILGFGGSFGDNTGFMVGGTGYFQSDKNLFSVRYVLNPQFEYNTVAVGFVGFPSIVNKGRLEEYAIMYGRRSIKEGSSISYSAGISYNTFETGQFNQQVGRFKEIERFPGISYEIDIKWFKRKKTRHRVYMIIPVGKPTAFSRSFGFKLMGNFSKSSYIGFGMTYGFGWYKKYSEVNSASRL